MCAVFLPSHLPWFDLSTGIWGRVRILKHKSCPRSFQIVQWSLMASKIFHWGISSHPNPRCTKPALFAFCNCVLGMISLVFLLMYFNMHFLLYFCNTWFSVLHFCWETDKIRDFTVTGFEELYCECGSSVLYPPIPCGTRRPECSKPCSRPHSCEHPTLHPCHSQPVCPPCTVLTQKYCYGKHEVSC